VKDKGLLRKNRNKTCKIRAIGAKKWQKSFIVSTKKKLGNFL
jgi:hypothetical protein